MINNHTIESYIELLKVLFSNQDKRLGSQLRHAIFNDSTEADWFQVIILLQQSHVLEKTNEFLIQNGKQDFYYKYCSQN